ncbi:hypothetical protein [Rhodoflexus caldus]|uniref:hypothetical protein n=1 Tax=Rhodoflexus caldus TaxID=2891236 RepID=UPI00202A5B54|nr:hypothetical protein [Rhodoflexus caldus]
MKNIVKGLLLSAATVFPVVLYSQSGNSPYSLSGLGELAPRASLYSQAMGGTGVSNSTPTALNLTNPALLSRNSIMSFEAAYYGELKQLRSSELNRRYSYGNLGYLAFSFPIVPTRLTFATGLQPYSTVNYKLIATNKLPFTPTFTEYRFQGSGSVSQAFLSVGTSFFKRLHIGATANYNFGFVQTDIFSVLIDNQFTGGYTTGSFDRVNISAITYRLGAAYRQPIGKDKSINIGYTTEPEANMNATRLQAIQRKNIVEEIISSDTIFNGNVNRIFMPRHQSFGISFEKPYAYTFAIDYSMQPWSAYRGINQENLADSWRIGIGAEVIPNISSLNSYFARVAYRAGGYYTLTPTVLNGQQIEEFGINFGIALPVSRTFSTASLVALIGQRGTTENNLLKENFFRLTLGLTVNDPYWFQKRRIN